MTKPLQREGSVLKRGRLLGLKTTPPAKSSADAALAAEAGEAREKKVRPRRALSGPPPARGAGR